MLTGYSPPTSSAVALAGLSGPHGKARWGCPCAEGSVRAPRASRVNGPVVATRRSAACRGECSGAERPASLAAGPRAKRPLDGVDRPPSRASAASRSHAHPRAPIQRAPGPTPADRSRSRASRALGPASQARASSLRAPARNAARRAAALARASHTLKPSDALASRRASSVPTRLSGPPPLLHVVFPGSQAEMRHIGSGDARGALWCEKDSSGWLCREGTRWPCAIALGGRVAAPLPRRIAPRGSLAR